eukprot:935644-Prymnesium_polylepis.2
MPRARAVAYGGRPDRRAGSPRVADVAEGAKAGRALPGNGPPARTGCLTLHGGYVAQPPCQ